jgi:hypothetical protein
VAKPPSRTCRGEAALGRLNNFGVFHYRPPVAWPIAFRVQGEPINSRKPDAFYRLIYALLARHAALCITPSSGGLPQVFNDSVAC